MHEALGTCNEQNHHFSEDIINVKREALLENMDDFMSAFERKFIQASEEVELGYNFAQEIHNIKEAEKQRMM